MKKKVLIATLCVGLILITPLAGIAQENKISDNLTKPPNNDDLVAQIKTIINEILQKYGNIPIVSNFGNLILNLLELIGKIVFCIFLLIIIIPIVILADILTFIGVFLGTMPIYLIAILVTLASIYDGNCPPSTPLNNLLSQFKSLYTFSEINEITKHAKECPCLKE